jgi:hypothetical protein
MYMLLTKEIFLVWNILQSSGKFWIAERKLISFIKEFFHRGKIQLHPVKIMA